MKRQLHRVQWLRLAAATMVLIGHAQVGALDSLDASGTFQKIGNAAFWAGGVDVFFVISGFIMYTVAHGEFGHANAPGAFLSRRLIRIVPPYWLLTSAMLAAMVLFSQHVAHSEVDAGNILASYLFLPAANAYGEPFPLLALGWTLNFEMMFYVLFALSLRWARPHGTLVLLCMIAAIGTIGAVSPPRSLPLSFWCNPIVFEFGFGVVLGLMHARGWRLYALARHALLIAAVVLLYAGSAHSDADPLWPARAFWMGLPAALLCASMVLLDEPARSSRVSRALVLGGDASYAIYLIHPFCLGALRVLWQGAGWQAPWLYVLVGCVLSIAVGLAFHVWVERPLVSRLGDWVRQRRAGVQRNASQGVPGEQS